MMASTLIATTGAAPADDDFERIERSYALEPGQYWRLKKGIEVPSPHSSSYRPEQLMAGDIHLVTKLFEFDGSLHSVTFLDHPREASINSARFDSHTLLVKDFLDAFEPVPMDEAKAVRAAEQAEVMDELREIQDEMQQAQINPLMLPAVQEAAKEAVEDFEAKELARVQAEVQSIEKRTADLRRIHRRAARRSEAKGNPIALRKVTISDRLDVMISEGVTSDGVRDLQLEAGRRLAIAEATSKWLAERSEAMTKVVKRLTPYMTEAAQLALAGASTAIDRVTQIERGITSLKLYTGDGVDVVPVREGADAPTHEPLTLMQRKLAMDEELVVHADIDESFDCASKQVFFSRLATDDALLNQILPTPRCVVSMQVTRRSITYGERMSAFEILARSIENRTVFLLVRNGDNVHAVYSSEPSHEAADRLFPTEADIHAPFKGIDGSSIGLKDVAFGEAAGRFEDQALHYRRLLILLCGLDHRLNLFGEFFPPERKPAFMSQAFQEKFFRFIEDDDESRLLGGQRESVHAWMKRHNANLRSGSRVVVQSGSVLDSATHHIARSKTTRIDGLRVRSSALIAGEKAGHMYLQIPSITDGPKGTKLGTAAAWISGPNAYKHEGLHDWFLCMDRIRPAEVRRYIADRSQRIGSISWLRTLRRVLAQLEADNQAEAGLREFLRKSALDAQVHTEATVDEAVFQAIATWRADHRGAAAPDLADRTGVSQLLSLVFPKDQLSRTLMPQVIDLCERTGLQPLMLTRTGRNELVLYSVVPVEDRAEYSTCVQWGWVRRHLLKPGKARFSLGSASTTWLQMKLLDSTEEILHRWDGLDAWTHVKPEPCTLRTLRLAKLEFERGQSLVESLARSRDTGAGLDPQMLAQWISAAVTAGKDLTQPQTALFWIPLGAYQPAPEVAPRFVYARSTLLSIVRALGTPAQRDQLMQSRGYRSSQAKTAMAKPAILDFDLCTDKDLNPKTIELSGRSRTWATPDWLTHNTHKPGGLQRNVRNNRFYGPKETRAQRRVSGGDPRHEELVAALSMSRAIDALMGKSPLTQRAFYRDVKKRMEDIWTGENITERRLAERDKRFTPPVPVAVHLAPCLWDEVQGRSMANRWLGAVKITTC